LTIRNARIGTDTAISPAARTRVGRGNADGRSAVLLKLSDLNSLNEKAIIALMKKASITDAKNRLSALIDGLKGGDAVLIVDRGRPVARLEPVSSTGTSEPAGRLSRLIRDGILRPSRAAPSRTLFETPPPRAKAGASAVAALIAERREGR
jgi:prevent-host-death family protein